MNNVEYNLWLENDVNTKGHTQWFYFKVLHKYPKSKPIFPSFNLIYRVKDPIQHLESGKAPESVFPWHETVHLLKETL